MTGILLKEAAAAPGTPASGYVNLYAKDDNKLYYKDDLGVESGFVSSLPRNYIDGFVNYRATSPSNIVTIQAGVCRSEQDTDDIRFTSIMNKSYNNSWVAGTNNGGLDTGAAAASTWYFIHVIKNPTTQAVDFLLSVNVSSPTLPSGYTRSKLVGVCRSNAANDGLENITGYTLGGQRIAYQWNQLNTVVNTGTATTQTAFTVSNHAPTTTVGSGGGRLVPEVIMCFECGGSHGNFNGVGNQTYIGCGAAADHYIVAGWENGAGSAINPRDQSGPVLIPNIGNNFNYRNAPYGTISSWWTHVWVVGFVMNRSIFY